MTQDTEKPFPPLSLYAYTTLYAEKKSVPFREVYRF